MTDDYPDDVEREGDQLTRTTATDADDTSAPETTDATARGAADATAPDATDTTAPDTADEFERSAESFVELEAELGEDDAAPGRARVVGAETVPAAEVPADYPRQIETGRALALGLAVAGADDATAFFAWPPADDDAALARLLAALDISQDAFADLNGRRLLVTVEDGFVLPIVPPTRPRGSEHGLAGILAGHAATLGLLAAGVLGALELPAILLGLLLVTIVVLPISTYLDAWHLKSTTDWDQGPLFWALLQALPGANVLVTAAYLWFRKGARALDQG